MDFAKNAKGKLDTSLIAASRQVKRVNIVANMNTMIGSSV